MNDSDDIDMLAAEYALGTLDAAERAAAEARRGTDAAFNALVTAWEHRLAPLAETTAEVTPPGHLLPLITRRIQVADAAVRDSESATVVVLNRRVRRWRSAAVSFGALAAALAVGLGLRESLRPAQPANFVAVLQQTAASPAFIVSVDLDTRSLTVRPVAPQPQPGHSFELWIIDASLGQPRSLGVVGDRTFSTAHGLPYTPSVVQNATYAVSVEPEGGSPTGAPTGPVVYTGKLIQATP